MVFGLLHDRSMAAPARSRTIGGPGMPKTEALQAARLSVVPMMGGGGYIFISMHCEVRCASFVHVLIA